MTEGRALAESVCESLVEAGRVAFAEVPLEGGLNAMRADVLTLLPGYFWEHSDVCVYEIKTNRSDFLGDRRRGKTLRYREYAHRVYYLAAESVMAAGEVPEEVGVARFDSDGIHIEREAPRGTPKPNIDLILYLLGRSTMPRSDRRPSCVRAW